MQVFKGRFDRCRAQRPVLAQAGFTLIELMVTLIVLAVLLAIATPSFTSIHNSNRLVSATNEMVATLQQARMEAVRLNGRTVVCRSTDGATCADGELWSQWITLADTDRDGSIDDLVRVSHVNAPVQMRASAAIADANSKIIFRPDGLARTAGGNLLKASIAICVPTRKPVENQRVLQIASGSRISSEPSDANGQCAAPAN